MWRVKRLHGDDMVMILKNVSAYYCLEIERKLAGLHALLEKI